MNGGDHGRLLQAGNHTITIDRPRGCDAHGMAIQTSFAKKMTGSYDCNHRLLALLGNDGQLDVASLNVKDRVRRVSLGEDNLIPPVMPLKMLGRVPTIQHRPPLPIQKLRWSIVPHAPFTVRPLAT